LPSLLGPIHRGKMVATKLVQEVRALPVPDTDAGRSAAIHLEDEVRAVFDRLATEERRVRSLSESPTLLQTIRALNDLEVAFAQAVSGLKTIDYGVTTYVPDLQQSFENAESCKELNALGED
jgi:hypothetical protein